MRFAWSCSRDDGMPCFGAGGIGDLAGATWTIPGGSLTAEISHKFAVTVSKGAY